ncbi:MAG: toll/interleukin-1 receptor domain-containing protein [Terriglobia bacterium]
MTSVVIIYSHTDGRWLRRMEIQLRPVERITAIDLWADTRIRAGKDWAKEIDAALARACVAILLVSADFLASEFITSTELPALLRKASQGQCKILPVIVGPCLFSDIRDLQQFQAINSPERPLSGMKRAQSEGMLSKVAKAVLGIARGQATSRQILTSKPPYRFSGDPEVDEVIKGIRLADWDLAAEAALKVIAMTDADGHNQTIAALLSYQDCPDDDDRFWGAFHTLESAVRVAPWLIGHAQLSKLAEHNNFSVRSTAASICMDLAHSAPDRVPLDIVLKLSKSDEDWYVQAPANAALKAMARSFPDVLRIFYTRLRSEAEDERWHSLAQIEGVAKEEPGLIEPQVLREEAVRLKRLGDLKASDRLHRVLSRVKKVKRTGPYRYGL